MRGHVDKPRQLALAGISAMFLAIFQNQNSTPEETTMHRNLLAGLALSMASTLATAADLTVTHWGVLMYGTPYAVAKDKGYFAERGVEIDGFITSKGGGTTLRNMLASELRYGEVSLAATVAAFKQGVELKIVNTGARSVGEILWVTRPDSEVQTIADLEGRVMGFTSPKSVTEMLAIMSLEESGIALDAVKRVALGGIGSGLTALSEGGADAAPVMDPIWAGVADKFRPVFFAKDVLPPMTQTVGVVASDYLTDNREQVAAIIDARRAGVEFIYENPVEAAAILAEAYDMDPAIAETSVNNLVEIQWWSTGEFEMEGLDNMIRGLQIVGEQEGSFDWSTILDDSLL